MVGGDKSYDLSLERGETKEGTKEGGGKRSPLCPISAAISGAQLERVVQERARITLFERGGLGKSVDGITSKERWHHPDRLPHHPCSPGPR